MPSSFLSKFSLTKSPTDTFSQDGSQRSASPQNRSRRSSRSERVGPSVSTGAISSKALSRERDETRLSSIDQNDIEIGVIPPSPSVTGDFGEAAEAIPRRRISSLQQRRRTENQSNRQRPGSVDRANSSQLNMIFYDGSSPKPLPDDMATPMPRSTTSSPRLDRKVPLHATKTISPASSTGNLKSRPPSITLTEDNFVGETPKRTPSRSSSIFKRRSKMSTPALPADGLPPITSSSFISNALSSSPEHATFSAAAASATSVTSATPTNGTAPTTTPSQPLNPRTVVPEGNSPATPSGKRGWRRGSAPPPSKKPTGLAAAIAASGMGMANPYASSVNLQQPVLVTGSPRAPPPPMPSPAQARSRHAIHTGRHRAASSVSSNHISGGSGGESDGVYGSDLSGTEDSEESENDLDFLNEAGMLPVTGFAVASNKRNQDFHELFKAVPEGDYLIEDYGCALQREILIQGRIYISENHICFHANIFGWITDLQIPFSEIIAVEKKMTAFVIPNAIQINTRQAKYNFASFLSRDTTYDVIYNIWRTARPLDSASIVSSSARSNFSGGNGNPRSLATVAVTGAGGPKVTQCACGKDGKHFTEVAMDAIVPGTPEKIYNLVFASAWVKNFLTGNQKLLDLQISDWAPTGYDPKLISRNMSYVKPLNGSIGPKQTKCEIRDETIHCDFDDYVVMMTTTRTPDVPSGNAFSVKTRTCLMWASAASTKIVVTTEVQWSGRSFIKGIIESSCINGQKTFHANLEAAMREEIKNNASEFIPEGLDVVTVQTETPTSPGTEVVMTPGTKLTHAEAAQREKERNARGLQWAYDTFEGAYKVGKQSAMGAIELIQETWEASSSTTILIFIVVILVLSNLYTLSRVGFSHQERTALKRQEKEQWVHGIVTALWEELAVNGQSNPNLPSISDGRIKGPESTVSTVTPAVPSWRTELSNINDTLTELEKKLKYMRQTLDELV